MKIITKKRVKSTSNKISCSKHQIEYIFYLLYTCMVQICMFNVCIFQGGPLKSLRELLHAGERLGAEMPAIEALRARIRRREWEESARRALAGKSSLTSLAGESSSCCLHCTTTAGVLIVCIMCRLANAMVQSGP